MASLQIHPPFLWTAGTIWPPICLAIVAARFVMRKSQRMRYGLDDWLTLPALILILGMAATILAGVAQHALGYPTPKPEPGTELTATSPQQTVTRKAYMAITLMQTAALTFIKLSCMLFYQRIFRTASHIANILIYIILALILVWGLGFFFSFLFACNTHFDYFWTNLENQLKCPADLSKIDLSLSVSDVVMDVILLAFPIPWIMRMQISWGNKLLVLGIFTLGGLAVAASITRLVIIGEELNVEFAATADEDFVSTAGLYFMYIEACFALTAICLPSLSGIRKNRAIKNLIEGFRSVFSSNSRGSGSRIAADGINSREAPEDISICFEEPLSQPTSSAEPISIVDDADLEMQPLPKKDHKHTTVTCGTE
ncbi:hypothetical protein BGW36DRAFT_423841 [Talaromyces proteolyticus]|uniref:Rhodopsin domain-containing protein n=1 Tax=Talaromyces proteolyticus TaxID=1131652 RepID=A0AAD4KW84_9EURO|nr:uncharacterized protein BGW36DRAFT_423841 [Talaromyces proteolyticus]KAH8701529.1 hypothetical protein BGW36DRAFT_423841 [Talaromyces proteolyticus]